VPAAGRRSIVGLVLGRLRWVLVEVVVVVTVAVVGYRVLEGYGWFDALYMTAITLGTVGYGETHPLDTAGRVFTIGLIATGFALAVHGFVTLSALIVSGDLTRAVRANRMVRVLDRLRDHVIVVGHGRVGRAVTSALRRNGTGYVVVDRDEALVEVLREQGLVAIHGDAEQDETLLAARIDRASALVSAAPEDATNLVVVLSARALCPTLRIVARVEDQRWCNRLLKAGADVIRNPYDEFGSGLAVSAVDARVVGVQDLPEWGLRIAEIEVAPGSPWAGRVPASIATDLPGVVLLGLRSEHGMRRWHEIDGPLGSGDVVVALGPPGSIERLRTG